MVAAGAIREKKAKDIKDRMIELKNQDEEALKKRQPATKKLKALDSVIRHLRNQTLVADFVDLHVLREVASWLAPDVTKEGRVVSIPHVKIRTELIKVIADIYCTAYDDLETLKDGSIGTVLMTLLAHKVRPDAAVSL